MQTGQSQAGKECCQEVQMLVKGVLEFCEGQDHIKISGDWFKRKGEKQGPINLEKSEKLNSFFQSFLTKEDTGNLPDPPKYKYNKELEATAITDIYYVQRLLADLHTQNKSPGPDIISPLIFATPADLLSASVCRSLEKGISQISGVRQT
ncbi:hypothetical protein ElyMa_000112000 [Elysia marginata]|uniref:Uncharacterized protein n=1 Tax=Elysia marginata TaxID=1093978 RepID=A0AAV4EL57_9GAST|nr:hypothetical protein ElyMa_000112000 [Elysia marginata]